MPVKEKTPEELLQDKIEETANNFKRCQNAISEDTGKLLKVLDNVCNIDMQIKLLEAIVEGLDQLIQNTVKHQYLFNQAIDDFRQMKASRIETAST
jgi:hypothetical protein